MGLLIVTKRLAVAPPQPPAAEAPLSREVSFRHCLFAVSTSLDFQLYIKSKIIYPEDIISNLTFQAIYLSTEKHVDRFYNQQLATEKPYNQQENSKN